MALRDKLLIKLAEKVTPNDLKAMGIDTSDDDSFTAEKSTADALADKILKPRRSYIRGLLEELRRL